MGQDQIALTIFSRRSRWTLYIEFLGKARQQALEEIPLIGTDSPRDGNHVDNIRLSLDAFDLGNIAVMRLAQPNDHPRALRSVLPEQERPATASRRQCSGYGSGNILDLHPAGGRLAGSPLERFYAVRSL